MVGSMNATHETNTALLDRDRAHLVHPLHEPALHAQGRVWVNGEGADPDRRGRAGMHRRTGGAVERHGGARPARAGGGDADAGRDAGLLLGVQRQLESPRHRAGRAARVAVLPLDQPLLLHQRRRRGHREQHQGGPRLLEAQGAPGQDEGHLPHRRLPRRDAGRDERDRHLALLAAVRAARAGVRAHTLAVPVPLRGAGGRQPGPGRGERAGAGHPARRVPRPSRCSSPSPCRAPGA